MYQAPMHAPHALAPSHSATQRLGIGGPEARLRPGGRLKGPNKCADACPERVEPADSESGSRCGSAGSVVGPSEADDEAATAAAESFERLGPRALAGVRLRGATICSLPARAGATSGTEDVAGRDAVVNGAPAFDRVGVAGREPWEGGSLTLARVGTLPLSVGCAWMELVASAWFTSLCSPSPTVPGGGSLCGSTCCGSLLSARWGDMGRGSVLGLEYPWPPILSADRLESKASQSTCCVQYACFWRST
jgi:hypothetical protein